MADAVHSTVMLKIAMKRMKRMVIPLVGMVENIMEWSGGELFTDACVQ